MGSEGGHNQLLDHSHSTYSVLVSTESRPPSILNLKGNAGSRPVGPQHCLAKSWGLGQWLSSLFVYGNCCLGAQSQTSQHATTVPRAVG